MRKARCQRAFLVGEALAGSTCAWHLWHDGRSDMIYSKTSTGQQVIKDRSVSLTPRQRTTLILVDGKRTAQELLRATSQTGGTADDLESLVALGLIAAEIVASPPGTASSEADPAADAGPQRSDQERFAQGYPIAAQL